MKTIDEVHAGLRDAVKSFLDLYEEEFKIEGVTDPRNEARAALLSEIEYLNEYDRDFDLEFEADWLEQSEKELMKVNG